MALILADHHISRTEVIKHPKNLYIFADNADRTSGKNPIDTQSTYYIRYNNFKPLYYPFTTTACWRGLENALPLTLCKHYKSNTESNLFDDGERAVFAWHIWEDFMYIVNYVHSEEPENIVIPANKFIGGKISRINQYRTPKLLEILNDFNSKLDMLARGF